jgi:outer membrane protein OmpA-like peptidoglycan-associated protein
MRTGTRAAFVVAAVALVAAGTACSTKKNLIKLEMTRETVITAPTIESLTLDPSGRIDTRERGYTVEVTMTGDAGLDATFDVEGRVEGRVMQEGEPGVYAGSFNAVAGETGSLSVVGHLVHAASGAHQSLRESGALELWLSPVPSVASGECTEAMKAEFDAALRPLTVNFPSAESVLDDAARSLLRDNLETLESHPFCVIYVLGHSDSSGEERLNELLSWERAMEINKFLESLGIPRYRIEAHYFGESQPANGTETRDALTRNRRGELRAINPYTGLEGPK